MANIWKLHQKGALCTIFGPIMSAADAKEAAIAVPARPNTQSSNAPHRSILHQSGNDVDSLM